MASAGVAFSEVLRYLADVLRRLKYRRMEGREGLKRGLRVGMEAAMMPTLISRLRHNSTWLAGGYRIDTENKVISLKRGGLTWPTLQIG